MPIPEHTSVEAFERYVGGQCLRAGRGEAWRDIKAWLIAPPRNVPIAPLPAVSEPFIAWTCSGEAEFQERENSRQPWITHRIKKGSFFLTSGGPPYDCRWRAIGSQPFETLLVFIELPALQRALEDTFGLDAPHARLRDLSAFTDDVLDSFMERLREELMRRHASPLYLQAIAQATAVHLARNYAELVKQPRHSSPSLPGFKLRQITDWMAGHVDQEFNLDQLAEQAGLSKFHFNRLFKKATGMSPSRYHIHLRMDAARRMLRETRESVLSIALEVGYANPSHFARLFRRQTGLSPSDYRRQR